MHAAHGRKPEDDRNHTTQQGAVSVSVEEFASMQSKLQEAQEEASIAVAQLQLEVRQTALMQDKYKRARTELEKLRAIMASKGLLAA